MDAGCHCIALPLRVSLRITYLVELMATWFCRERLADQQPTFAMLRDWYSLLLVAFASLLFVSGVRAPALRPCFVASLWCVRRAGGRAGLDECGLETNWLTGSMAGPVGPIIWIIVLPFKSVADLRAACNPWMRKWVNDETKRTEKDRVRPPVWKQPKR